MREQYIIHIDGKKKEVLNTYQEALRYVKTNYGDMTDRMDWEPKGSGGVDLWDNGITTIMIEKNYPDGIDLIYLAKEHDQDNNKENEKEHEDPEVYDQEEKKKMPYTPRRTTLKMKRKKKVSVMNVGDIKEGEDGNMYICKEKSNGKLFWTRYTQKTYEGAPTKKENSIKNRKCPSKPAKEYAEGVTKKGEDGKMWVVKLMNNGNHRWFRKSK